MSFGGGGGGDGGGGEDGVSRSNNNNNNPAGNGSSAPRNSRFLRAPTRTWRGFGAPVEEENEGLEDATPQRTDSDENVYDSALELADVHTTKMGIAAKPADGKMPTQEAAPEEPLYNPRWYVTWPDEGPSICDYLLYPPRTVVAWFRLLGDNYGWNYMSFIIIFMLGNFIPTILDYVYRSINAPSILVQSLENVQALPQLLSPLLGLMVNLCPIAGWHFNPYIIISTVVGVIGYLVIGLVPASAYLGFERGNIFREICFPPYDYYDALAPGPEMSPLDLVDEPPIDDGVPTRRRFLQQGLNDAAAAAASSLAPSPESDETMMPALECELLPQSVLGTIIISICATFVVFSAKVPDNIIQGISAAKIKRIPAFGPDLATFNVQFFLFISLVQYSFSGALIDNLPARYGYIIGAFMISLILFNVWRNSLGERRLEKGKRGFRWDKLEKHRKTIVFALLLGLLGIAQALTSLFLVLFVNADVRTLSLVQFLVSTSFLGIVITLMVFMLPTRVALANIWIMINAACAPTAGQATFYFLADDPEAYPDGPHFSPYILATALPIVSLVFSFLGSFLYVKFMPNWKYRFVITLNIILMSLLNLLDVIFFRRWNKRVGIPDIVFLLGAQALPSAFVIMTNMPLSILMNQLTPHNIEATAMAIMTCCQTFGQNMGKNMGTLVNAYLDVNPSGQRGDAEQFENLWVNPVLNIALSFVVSWPLVYFMIPDARQTDNLAGSWIGEGETEEESRARYMTTEEDEIDHPSSAMAVGSPRDAYLLKEVAADPLKGLYNTMRRTSLDDSVYRPRPGSEAAAKPHASLRRTSLDMMFSPRRFPDDHGSDRASVTGVSPGWMRQRSQDSQASQRSTASMMIARRNRRDATIASLRAAAASMGQTTGLGRGGGAGLIQSTAPAIGQTYGGRGAAYNDASMRLVAANAAIAAELDMAATEAEDDARKGEESSDDEGREP